MKKCLYFIVLLFVSLSNKDLFGKAGQIRLTNNTDRVINLNWFGGPLHGKKAGTLKPGESNNFSYPDGTIRISTDCPTFLSPVLAGYSSDGYTEFTIDYNCYSLFPR